MALLPPPRPPPASRHADADAPAPRLLSTDMCLPNSSRRLFRSRCCCCCCCCCFCCCGCSSEVVLLLGLEVLVGAVLEVAVAVVAVHKVSRDGGGSRLLILCSRVCGFHNNKRSSVVIPVCVLCEPNVPVSVCRWSIGELCPSAFGYNRVPTKKWMQFFTRSTPTTVLLSVLYV